MERRRAELVGFYDNWEAANIAAAEYLDGGKHAEFFETMNEYVTTSRKPSTQEVDVIQSCASGLPNSLPEGRHQARRSVGLPRAGIAVLQATKCIRGIINLIRQKPSNRN